MAINKKAISKLKKLEKELEELKSTASDLLAGAKTTKEAEHEIERDGEKITVTEKDLWEEVFRLGKNCQAGELLQKEYPQVFEAYEKQEAKAKEIDELFVKEFGFQFAKITPSRLIKFVEAIIDYKNE
jgi:uncharacterized protein YaaN involved in tellurite resistance